jgi:hypothetical protein
MRSASSWTTTSKWNQSCTEGTSCAQNCKTGVLVALLIAAFGLAHEIDFREQCGRDPACASQHLETQ